MKPDYLILGSGLSALSFGALMAKRGKIVQIIEAHDVPGGYGHTFVGSNKYSFNAQFHYVWNCGEGETVHNLLKKLGLAEKLTFEQYDLNGFDHMHMPGYKLRIPNNRQILINRLCKMFPQNQNEIEKFIDEVFRVAREVDHLPQKSSMISLAVAAKDIRKLVRYRNATLQDVFEQFQLPLEVQTLLALQWPDFLLPPEKLSFIAWVLLFTGYIRGAYYPTDHFESIINSLVDVITSNRGEVILGTKVTQFIMDRGKVKAIKTESTTDETAKREFSAKTIVCNIDPKWAADLIGLKHFSPNIRKKLDYEYSPSNFMAYCVVKGLDLRDHGFGKWNIFHTDNPNLNECFDMMYTQGDYSKPSFAITTPSLLSNNNSDCPKDCQLVEFLTVANYQRFLELRISNPRLYRLKKRQIMDSILDIMERDYVPNFRKYLVFEMLGSPTTNQRYCWSPYGNSYGSNLTPENMGINRLDSESSIDNFYFCNASSGMPGFVGTIWTGARLYEKLTDDSIN